MHAIPVHARGTFKVAFQFRGGALGVRQFGTREATATNTHGSLGIFVRRPVGRRSYAVRLLSDSHSIKG